MAILALGLALGCGGSRSTEPPPPAQGSCPGICYHDLPDGRCETVPTCCPVTHPHSNVPHCPEGYTLDMNAGPEKCQVNHLCVD